VALAEAATELGGRVTRESRLPGLSSWARVRDYRLDQLQRLANVETFPASPLTAAQVLEFGFDHVVVATGATWRRDGVGYRHHHPIEKLDHPHIVTPGDVMNGITVGGPVVVFDDDHYYMGGVLAEKLRQMGLAVTLVTPAESASFFTHNMLDHGRIPARLIELDVAIVANRKVTAFHGDHVETACVYTGRLSKIECASVVTVTARNSRDELAAALRADEAALRKAGIQSVRAIADAYAPATIAHAVYAGHRYARELDAAPVGEMLFKREMAAVV
jgi:dimethylamine/trimethylamine dehydrogenase